MPIDVFVYQLSLFDLVSKTSLFYLLRTSCTRDCLAANRRRGGNMEWSRLDPEGNRDIKVPRSIAKILFRDRHWSTSFRELYSWRDSDV